MAEIKSQQKMDWAGDHLSPLILHCQLQYHLWVDAKFIFIYQNVFLISPNSSEMTSEATISQMGGCWKNLLKSKSFLIFLNLNNLSQEQKWLKFYTLVPTLFIIKFNSNNNLIWVTMHRAYYLSFPSKPWRN